MTEPKLVRIRRKGGKVIVDCDVYIGRRMTMGGWNLLESKWANPFPLKKLSLEESLCLYEQHILSSPELIDSLNELTGKTLGCWCKPKRCHGDVLIELWKMFISEEDWF
jgi:hypothetical protein